MIVLDLVSAIQGPNERFDKFAQRFQNIWRMIPEPLFESHVTSIFVHNIHPKCLVDMGDLKYENPPKETKGGRYQKKEDKEIHAIKEPPSKEQ